MEKGHIVAIVTYCKFLIDIGELVIIELKPMPVCLYEKSFFLTSRKTLITLGSGGIRWDQEGSRGIKWDQARCGIEIREA